MLRKTKAFTLVELLVVVGIIALLIAILLPSLGRARELSKRTACQANVTSVGKSMFVFSEDNKGQFPAAPHRTNTTGAALIKYMGHMGNLNAAPGIPTRTQESTTDATTGSTLVAVSRSLWLLVRSSGIAPKNFICPSSEDNPDPTADITTYYDFVGFGSLSYGYQVPYDQVNLSKPTPDVDPRMALYADRGPWSSRGTSFTGTGIEAGFALDTHNPAKAALYAELIDTSAPGPLTDQSAPDLWKPYNSTNHGGPRQGEGQNVLYPDIHAEWNTKPTAGVDSDNIYTRMDYTQGTGTNFARALHWGALPPDITSASGEATTYLPGDESLGANADSASDSLLWP